MQFFYAISSSKSSNIIVLVLAQIMVSKYRLHWSSSIQWCKVHIFHFLHRFSVFSILFLHYTELWTLPRFILKTGTDWHVGKWTWQYLISSCNTAIDHVSGWWQWVQVEWILPFQRSLLSASPGWSYKWRLCECSKCHHTVHLYIVPPCKNRIIVTVFNYKFLVSGHYVCRDDILSFSLQV